MSKLIIICIVAVLFTSCVLPDDAASPEKNSQSSVAFTVNGNPVTNEELLKSPIIRQSMEQVLLLYGLKSMVAVQGITLDPNVLDERMAEFKAEATARGRAFEDLMDEMKTTEADYRENVNINLLWEKLLESRLEYTDADLQALWESNPGRFNNIYARDNGLTDNEKEVLTFEEVYDTVFEIFKNDEYGFISQELQQDILDGIDLKITCISDPVERKFFEDMIINKKKSTYVAPESPEAGAEATIPGSAMEEEMVVEADEVTNPCDNTENAPGDDPGEEEPAQDVEAEN